MNYVLLYVFLLPKVVVGIISATSRESAQIRTSAIDVTFQDDKNST